MATEPDLQSKDPATRRAALQAIYARYKDEVYAFLVKLLRDRHLAEDVLQETFVRIHSNADRYDPSRDARPWVFEIARNAGLDALRRRSKRGAPQEPEDRPAGDGVLAELSEKDRVERARAALGSLPDETRALLIQRHGLNMKLEDLARSFAVTERTIRNRLNAAADEFAHALVRGKGGEA